VGREKLFTHPKYLRLLTDDTHDFGAYSNARSKVAKGNPE
jgi:hypothetical protein